MQCRRREAEAYDTLMSNALHWLAGLTPGLTGVSVTATTADSVAFSSLSCEGIIAVQVGR